MIGATAAIRPFASYIGVRFPMQHLPRTVIQNLQTLCSGTHPSFIWQDLNEVCDITCRDEATVMFVDPVTGFIVVVEGNTTGKNTRMCIGSGRLSSYNCPLSRWIFKAQARTIRLEILRRGSTVSNLRTPDPSQNLTHKL